MADDDRQPSGEDAIRDRFAEAEAITPDPEAEPSADIEAAPGAPDHDDMPPPRTPDEDDPRFGEGATFPLNDTGNGARFALYCGESALYIPRVGWHLWDQKRWRLDPDNIGVRRHAQSIQEHIVSEIPHVVLEDWQLETIATERQLLASRSRISSTISTPCWVVTTSRSTRRAVSGST